MKDTVNTSSRSIRRGISLLTCILVLVLGAGSVHAQFAPGMIFNGVETAQGVFDPLTGTRWGNTFILNSHGEWETKHLTLAINYFENSFNPTSPMEITGGSWSLVFFHEGAYAGTVYGEVTAGSVVFAEGDPKRASKPASKLATVHLKTFSGLGIFENGRHEGFDSIIHVNTNLTRSPFPATAMW
jgi:hypothetical protein